MARTHVGCARPRAPAAPRPRPRCPGPPTGPAPRLPRPPTPALRHSVWHFSFNPAPRHFLQKTETTRTCLKETAHLSALKGPAAAPRAPAAGQGRGEGAAALRATAIASRLPPAATRAAPGVCSPGKSRPPSRGGTGDSSPPPSFGLFLCHVDEIIGLGVLGVLFGLLVSLTQRIARNLVQNQTSPRTPPASCSVGRGERGSCPSWTPSGARS